MCFQIDVSWNAEPSLHRIAFAVDPSRERPSVFVHHTLTTSTGYASKFRCSPFRWCNSHQLFVSEHPSAKSTDRLSGTVHDTLLASTIAHVTLSAVDALVQVSHDVDDVARLSTPVLFGSRCDVQRLWLVRLHPLLFVSVDARASNCAITKQASLVAEASLCVRQVETTLDEEMDCRHSARLHRHVAERPSVFAVLERGGKRPDQKDSVRIRTRFRW